LLNRFESTRPVLSRHIPYIPEISRYFPLNGSVKAQKTPELTKVLMLDSLEAATAAIYLT